MKPVEVTPELLCGMALPIPDDGAGKEARGRILVIGGERELLDEIPQIMNALSRC